MTDVTVNCVMRARAAAKDNSVVGTDGTNLVRDVRVIEGILEGVLDNGRLL